MFMRLSLLSSVFVLFLSPSTTLSADAKAPQGPTVTPLVGTELSGVWLAANDTVNRDGSPAEVPGTSPKAQFPAPKSGGQQALPPGGFEPLPQPQPGTVQPGGVNPLDPSSPRPLPGTPLSTQEPAKPLLPSEPIRRLPPSVDSACNSPKINLVDGMTLPPIRGKTHMQDILLQPPANIPTDFEMTASGSLPIGASWATDGKQICIYTLLTRPISPAARSSQITFSIVGKGANPLAALRFRVLLPVALGIHTDAEHLGTTQFTLASGRPRSINLYASGDPVPPPTPSGPTSSKFEATRAGDVPSAPITWRYVPDPGHPGLPQGLQLRVQPDGNAKLEGTPAACVSAATRGRIEVIQRSQVVGALMSVNVTTGMFPPKILEVRQGALSTLTNPVPHFLANQRAALIGREFCPGSKIYLDGQEAPNVQVRSSTQIDFDLIRPGRVTAEHVREEGEPIAIQVASQQADAFRIRLATRSINVLSYNIYMRPPTPMTANGQADRAPLLPPQMRGHDVIILNEAFDDPARGVVLRGLLSEYPHATRILGSDRGIEQDGGVIMVSKWPIVDEGQLPFGEVCTNDGGGPLGIGLVDDCQSDKGVLYAKIMKGGYPYHIFGTHAQAGHTPTRRDVRRQQVVMMAQFIASKQIATCEAVIAGGDFNIDRHGPDISDYQFLLKTLAAVEPAQFNNLNQLNCTYCYGVNPLADDQAEGQAYLDHLLTSRSHLLPIASIVTVRRPMSPIPWRDNIRDLSDHFAIAAVFKFLSKPNGGC